MEPHQDPSDARRSYRPDDWLDYKQIEAEFNGLTARFVRHEYETGNIQGYRGAYGKNYFRYADLVVLRDVTLARYRPDPSRKKRSPRRLAKPITPQNDHAATKRPPE